MAFDMTDRDHDEVDRATELDAALTAVRSQPTPEQAEAAFRFFYDNAPYAYVPNRQTEEEGHRVSALRLANAEAWARTEGITFEWELDDTGDGGEIRVTAYGPDGELLDSTGGVDCETDLDWHRWLQADLAATIKDNQ